MLCGPYATVKAAEFRHWRVAETLWDQAAQKVRTPSNKRTFTFTNTSLQQFPSLNVRTSTRENLVCTPTTGCVIRLRSCFLRVCTQLHAKCEAGKKKKTSGALFSFIPWWFSALSGSNTNIDSSLHRKPASVHENYSCFHLPLRQQVCISFGAGITQLRSCYTAERCIARWGGCVMPPLPSPAWVRSREEEVV